MPDPRFPVARHIDVRAARPSGRARCGAGTGCSTTLYQSLLLDTPSLPPLLFSTASSVVQTRLEACISDRLDCAPDHSVTRARVGSKCTHSEDPWDQCNSDKAGNIALSESDSAEP